MVVRRASLAKVPTGIEAPITKVIGIILAAQQAAPMYVAQALEKVSVCGPRAGHSGTAGGRCGRRLVGVTA